MRSTNIPSCGYGGGYGYRSGFRSYGQYGPYGFGIAGLVVLVLLILMLTGRL